MKSFLILFIAIIAFIFVQAESPFAEEDEWEILLEEFDITDIAHEGQYVWCSTVNNGVLRYNKTDGSYIAYTTENGLPESILINNWVYCIAIDKNGFKWIGGRFGIASFDNTSWTVYSSEELKNYGAFPNVAVDHDNIKWFTSNGMIVAYNDTTFSFFGYDGASDIFVDHDNVKWFGVLSHRILYDNNEWFAYPWDNNFSFYTAVVDLNNRQFWGDERDGLRIYDGDEFITYTEMFGNRLTVISLAIDSHNMKWIGTDRSLLSYDDVEFKQVVLFTWGDHYFDIIDIEIDVDGSIWFIAKNTIYSTILAKYTPEDTTTHVEKEPLPEEITLHQAHPNPFNPTTTISYEIPFDAQVRLVVYDILGREITVLQDGMMSAGVHSVVWNGRDSDGELTGSGVYIYQLVAGESTAQGKMLLMR